MPDAAWSKVYCVIVLFNRMKAEARKQQVSKRLKMQASKQATSHQQLHYTEHEKI